MLFTPLLLAALAELCIDVWPLADNDLLPPSTASSERAGPRWLWLALAVPPAVGTASEAGTGLAADFVGAIA